MKWNDVELVDGKFYFVEVERWGDGEPNNWVFAYRDNNCFITQHYVCAKITGTDSRVCSVYDFGFVCGGEKIVSLLPASCEDVDAFWSCLDNWGYKYCLNTKNLRYVGCE